MPGADFRHPTRRGLARVVTAALVFVLTFALGMPLWLLLTPTYNRLAAVVATPMARVLDVRINQTFGRKLRTSFRPGRDYPTLVQRRGRHRAMTPEEQARFRSEVAGLVAQAGLAPVRDMDSTPTGLYLHGMTARQARALAGTAEEAKNPLDVSNSDDGILVYSTLKPGVSEALLRPIRWDEDLYPFPKQVGGSELHFNLVLYAALAAAALAAGTRQPWRARLLRAGAGFLVLLFLHALDLTAVAKYRYATLQGFGELYYSDYLRSWLLLWRLFCVHWLSLLVPAVLAVWIAGTGRPD